MKPALFPYPPLVYKIEVIAQLYVAAQREEKLALYRFEMKIIGRKAGHSATAAAAYRAGERIYDHRTGTTHDYSHRKGVIFSQVMTPPNTPEWMLNRERLWNAVEQAEKRKDAQLTRELLVALPHELNHDQHVDLVREYVHDQFVGRGMIADVNIHAPYSDSNDARNHHAHILLTMRSITSEGFGPKNRQWNDWTAQLKVLRERWADYQNRTFERLNMPIRVDSRSYETRDIDREPTLHMGAYAAKQEQDGNRTRLGDENRSINERNAQRADLARDRAELEYGDMKRPLPYRRALPDHQNPIIQREMNRREKIWIERDEVQRQALRTERDHALLDLDQRRHQPAIANLKAEIHERTNGMKQTMTAEVDAIDRRLQAKGVTRFFRNLFGRTARDQERRKGFVNTLANMAMREREALEGLRTRQQNEVELLKAQYDRKEQHLEKVLAKRAAMRAEAVLLARENRMRGPKDEFSRKTDRRQRPQEARDIGPPKPAPTLQPAPPRAAGPAPFGHSTPAPGQFAQRAAEWGNTPEGRKATEGYELDKSRIQERMNQGHDPEPTKYHDPPGSQDNSRETNRAELQRFYEDARALGLSPSFEDPDTLGYFEEWKFEREQEEQQAHNPPSNPRSAKNTISHDPPLKQMDMDVGPATHDPPAPSRDFNKAADRRKQNTREKDRDRERD